jgi:hypothetical protein
MMLQIFFVASCQQRILLEQVSASQRILLEKLSAQQRILPVYWIAHDRFKAAAAADVSHVLCRQPHSST